MNLDLPTLLGGILNQSITGGLGKESILGGLVQKQNPLQTIQALLMRMIQEDIRKQQDPLNRLPAMPMDPGFTPNPWGRNPDPGFSPPQMPWWISRPL